MVGHGFLQDVFRSQLIIQAVVVYYLPVSANLAGPPSLAHTLSTQ